MFDISRVACVKCFSDVDDVVLQYMVHVLQELEDSSASADLFDVEQFTEMMEAYLPGFQAVDRSAIIIEDVHAIKYLTLQKLIMN